MSIHGILFDKDGTLIDFDKTWLPRYNAAAEYLAKISGEPTAPATLMALGGYDAKTNSWQTDSLLASGSNDQILTAWADHLDLAVTGTVKAECMRLFSVSDSPYVAVLNDMDSFLAELNSRSYHLGVATMDDESTAHATLETMGVSHHFQFVCGADSGFGLKPDPGMVTAFCQSTRTDPANVVMVGDSPRDLVMGHNAGVALCVGVLTGAHKRHALAEYADVVCDDIGELPSVIDQL